MNENEYKLEIYVTKDNVTIKNKEKIHTGEYKITKCEFEFTEDYEGLTKKAIFEAEDVIKEMPIISNECDIPEEVLQDGYLSCNLRVYGYDIEEVDGEMTVRLRYSPTYDTFPIWKGSFIPNAEQGEEITPTQFEQYTAALNEGLEEVKNVDIDVSKNDKVATVEITNRYNETKSVGIKDGADFEYKWQGTSLGVKTDEEEEYEYVDLKGDIGPQGPKPVRGVDYFTTQDIAEMEDYVINASTSAFNQNATQKTNEFNSNATSKTETFNSNASSKTSEFNQNATAKTTAFNNNAISKINDFNNNASSKTTDFNDNATAKTTTYNTNAEEKLEEYNDNASYKVSEFNANVDNIEKQVTQAKLVYNALPKVTGSGEEITLNNTAETPLGITLKGNTYQETTTGKNLFNNNLTPSFTGNTTTQTLETGIKVISTTNISDPNTNINCRYIVCDVQNYIGQQITLSAHAKSSSTNNGMMYLRLCKENGDTSNTYGTQTTDVTLNGDISVTYTIPSEIGDYHYILVALYVARNSAVVVNDYVEYNNLQLELNSQVTSYEPYTNGASPNPDYPQEIQVVTGDNTIKVQNKNLFDITAFENQLVTGKILNDSGVEINDANSTYSKYVIPVKANTTYYRKGAWQRMYVYDKNMTLLTRGSAVIGFDSSFTVEQDGYIGFQIGNTYWASNKGQEQIEYGEQASPYVEHQEQNYPINLGTLELCKIGDYQDIIKRSTGKNLYDLTNGEVGNIDSSGNYTSNVQSWRNKNYISVTPNTQYTFSLTNRSSNYILRLAEYNSNQEFIIRSELSGSALTFTTTANTKYIKTIVYLPNTDMTQTIINNIKPQIEQGSTATYYEPYGVGNWYKYKAIGKVVLDGTENWNYQYANAWNTEISNIKTVPNANTQGLIISNYYEKGTANQVYQRSYGVALPANAEKITIKNIDMESATALKNWLSTHNTTVYYALETPTGELITDTTLIEQLNNLYYAYAYQEQTNINQENSNLASLMSAETTRDLSDIFTNEG